ncbi:mechanosensitive ion channel domain-containing protein [Microbacterium azadirachtae]|uniref:Low conductance mechanosensitive channel YnaI n=1 Tax=Microbacterium azadirachtae TaxID=582680 RepID=A0A0F0LH11_9MICO|nr:mechanosensitive ion channel domain-containing protein [Microbacterium azadirachtae]KJL32423.1 Low conductance mechanosensitive channel YnaI [Microbacterium azadirachtae]UXW86075.1 mechanosensitive ion channel [Microbacterium azadirachtae]SDL63908.1 Cyclic nucleotide-binding domain-containing protein [Microbacterium azadirachtae]SEF93075.1 Cyclic nucleotide-binding domain-containing protein [Microbacterium azadirachtae]SEF95496.1 Cyclic nucleotide-binding domain-containing protein [Microbac
MGVFQQGWTWWLIALAVGIPVLLVGLTELLGALRRRGNPVAKPVALLRNAVIPAGALFALLAFAIGQKDDGYVWVRVVATVFGFLLILLVLSAFNVVLFSNAEEGSWRRRVPSIFIEIARLVLVVVGLAMLFSWVWDADVGGLFTALGVTSIVIGLALQNAAGGVVSGLLLLFEQPFKIGDWLDTGGVKGRVVEVNWRAVHIDTGSGIQIVPNSTLSGASFTNMSEPTGPYYATASLKFSTDDPPQEVLALLVRLADGLPMRWRDERATAEYTGAAGYAVSIPINAPGEASGALSLYLSWLWYAARRRGFALDGDASDPIAEPAMLDAAIEEAAPVLRLDEAGKEILRAGARLQRYGAGETVLPAGVVPDEVRLIMTGGVAMLYEADGARITVAESGPRELIGQTALTRERTTVTIVATEVLTALRIPLEVIDALIRAHPRLAAEIGQSLDLKRAAAADVLAAAGFARGEIRPR